MIVHKNNADDLSLSGIKGSYEAPTVRRVTLVPSENVLGEQPCWSAESGATSQSVCQVYGACSSDGST